MGDWVSMEIKGKERTISSVFFRYACFYTAGVLFWIFFLCAVWYVLYATEQVLPANYMETRLRVGNKLGVRLKSYPEYVVNPELKTDSVEYTLVRK